MVKITIHRQKCEARHYRIYGADRDVGHDDETGFWIAATDAGGRFHSVWVCVVDDFGNLVPVR